jgi:hypothetical protein
MSFCCATATQLLWKTKTAGQSTELVVSLQIQQENIFSGGYGGRVHDSQALNLQAVVHNCGLYIVQVPTKD